MLTCKEFLLELNDYLDETGDIDLRGRIESHITKCPNCFVILDTTKKTIQVYKGVAPQTLPHDVHARLLKAVERKTSERKLRARSPGLQP